MYVKNNMPYDALDYWFADALITQDVNSLSAGLETTRSIYIFYHFLTLKRHMWLKSFPMENKDSLTAYR